jgi:hypothetical protein
VYFVLDPDFNVYMDIHQAINLEIIRAFARDEIEFAYPTQTLYLARTPPAEASPAAERAPTQIGTGARSDANDIAPVDIAPAARREGAA